MGNLGSKLGSHERLVDTLKQLFVISPKIKADLLQKFPEFSEEKQKKLVLVLEKSLKKQNEFLEKALAKKPDLMKDIKQGVGQKMKEIRKDNEAKSDEEEQELLKKLENDILGL